MGAGWHVCVCVWRYVCVCVVPVKKKVDSYTSTIQFLNDNKISKNDKNK